MTHSRPRPRRPIAMQQCDYFEGLRAGILLILFRSMGVEMKRRVFIGLIGGVAAWPLGVCAQQSTKMYAIGILSASGSSGSKAPGISATAPHLWMAFSRTLRDLGWIEGKNIVFEYRSADNRVERLPELAQELVRLNVDVIVAFTSEGAIAAKQSTTRIPIVLGGTGDPIAQGLVPSLARPGGNITGVSGMFVELGAKLLEVLKEALPGISRVAALWNPESPDGANTFKVTEAAGRALAVQVEPIEARTSADLDSAFQAVIRRRPDALITLGDPLAYSHRKQIADFAIRNRLPLIGGAREYADAGGLFAYGANFAHLREHTAGYVDKILKGAKPTDLPIEQPTKFELVVNLKTAKALGLAIPQSILLRANEVIE